MNHSRKGSPEKFLTPAEDKLMTLLVSLAVKQLAPKVIRNSDSWTSKRSV